MKKRTTSTDINNVLTDHFLFKRFEMLAINQIKWHGLYPTIKERYIERPLFDEGRVLLFDDKEDGLLCLPCVDTGHLNVYGEPLSFNAMGFGKTYRNIPIERAVLIENNKLRMPTRFVVEYFVRQLYELIRTRDTNIKTLKRPFLISCDDKQLLTFKKVIEDIDNNNYAIFGDSSFNTIDAVKVFQTGAKCIVGELTDAYHDILNEALTYMGINNANTDKRERLITSEAESNNQFIDSCANMFLESRARACEEANEKFGAKYGLNMSVELRTPRIEGKEEQYASSILD